MKLLLFSFKKYFIRTTKLYISIILILIITIRNIYVNYSQSGPILIYFKLYKNKGCLICMLYGFERFDWLKRTLLSKLEWTNEMFGNKKKKHKKKKQKKKKKVWLPNEIKCKAEI